MLGELAKEVYSVEIIPELAENARGLLAELGYQNVQVRAGDGYAGWPERAPFDVILVTAAPETIPEKLIEQLKPGGRMIVPVEAFYQDLWRITKTPRGEVRREKLLPVRFVPMVNHEKT